MEISFGKCSIEDIILLQSLSITTFTEAFKKHNNPKDFQAYLAKAFSKGQLLSELKNQNTSFYFAEKEGEVVGYFKTNVFEAQGELQEPGGMELERIYVTSPFQNQGIGFKMLSFAESLAIQQAKTYLWLGVWEHNLKAIRFYERNGYVKFGKHPYYIGRDKQNDWLLKKQFK